jgi:hypothetical protein
VTQAQARDILRIWQADRSWVAAAIEDNLCVVNCGGYLRDCGSALLDIAPADEKVVHVTLLLPPKATYRYRMAPNERADQPYEVLLIQEQQCMIYLAAFRTQPDKPVRL